MRPEKKLNIARYVSVVAATIIALACGTNYAYSAWGPQFAETLGYTSTQTNLISTSGNMGMYLCGIPLGILVDSAGARVGGLFGAFLLGIGYIGLYLSYANAAVLPLAVYCVLSAATGAGGCVAFLGAMKSAAINFPANRGTATSFPLAAFGLSAFFFSTVSGWISNDADAFLLLASWGTTTMTAIPCLFLRTTALPPSYSKLPTEAPRASRLDSSAALKHNPSGLSKKRESSPGPGTQYITTQGTYSSSSTVRDLSVDSSSRDPDKEPSRESQPLPEHDDSEIQINRSENVTSTHHSLYADVRGFAMLKYSECYELFILIGLLTGTGLMTINNIGQDSQSLWIHWDSSTSPDSVRKLARLHVSIISIGSFVGRLLSGIGSDIIVQRLHGSRFWCLFISAFLFTIAQSVGMSLNNPNLLPILSGTTGSKSQTISRVAYGFLFGVAPTLVADTFGVNGLSQNWGFMTLAPAFSSELFNIIYGKIYDSKVSGDDSGKLRCHEGKGCHQLAYLVTFVASASAMVIVLWCIRHRHVKEARLRKLEEDVDDGHLE